MDNSPKRRTFLAPIPLIEKRLKMPNPSLTPLFAEAPGPSCAVWSAAPAETTLPRGCIILSGSAAGGLVARTVAALPDEVDTPAGEVDPAAGAAPEVAPPGPPNENDPRRGWPSANGSTAGGLRGPVGADPGQPHLAPPAKMPPPGAPDPAGGVTAGGTWRAGADMVRSAARSSSSRARDPAARCSSSSSGRSQTPPRVEEGARTALLEGAVVVAGVELVAEAGGPRALRGGPGAAPVGGDDDGVGTDPASDDDEGDDDSAGGGAGAVAPKLALRAWWNAWRNSAESSGCCDDDDVPLAAVVPVGDRARLAKALRDWERALEGDWAC